MRITKLNESVQLTEFNNPKSQVRQRDREEQKRIKNEYKVLAIDFTKDAKDYLFYMPNKDGKTYNKKPYNQDKWIAEFREVAKDYKAAAEPTSPLHDKYCLWHNSLVTTPSGLIVRRGSEDLRGKVEQLIWGSNERGSNKFYIDVTNKDEQQQLNPETKQQDTSSDNSSVEQTDQSQKEQPQQQRQRQPKPELDPTKLPGDTAARFSKLVQFGNVVVKTPDGKQITNAKAIASLTPEQLVALRVSRNGKMIKFADWYKAAKSLALLESVELVEAPVHVQYDYDDMMDPSSAPSLTGIAAKIDAKEKAEKEQAAKEARRKQLRVKHADVIREMDELAAAGEQPSKILEVLFEELVPAQGVAETVAGELVRAMMRVLYRDCNDGDKFYESYGIETCGSSIAYLYDMIESVHQLIDKMYDRVHMYEADEDKYTEDLEGMATLVMNYIRENPETLDDLNEVDSRDYDCDWIEEKEPRYETEIGVSNDLYTLIDNGIVNSWKLNEYVEDAMSWESIYEGAEVSRPFSHHDTSVSISNLTKDALYQIEETWAKHLDSFWQDLVDEYADELEEINGDNSDDEYEDDSDDIDESISLDEGFVFTRGDEAIEGMMGNMDDAELYKNIRALNKAARLLNLDRPDDLVIFMDEDGAYSPTQFDGVAVGEKIQPHVVKNINLVSEMINGNLYLYFSNESNAKRYLNFIKIINQYE